jgi:2-iminobutanoate/2-iminopropanoate deaminase
MTHEMHERIFTPLAPEPIGPYSQAVRRGGQLFCSGQIPINPQTGDIVAGDVSAQAERVLRNLEAVLTAAGVTFADVVKTTIFLIDMNDFAAVNAVYEKYFGSAKPARSTVAVAALPKNARIEIDCIAVTRSS